MEESRQLHASADFPPEKAAWSALNRRLGGPQGVAGLLGKRSIIILRLPGIEPRFLGGTARRLVNIMTALQRLVYSY